MPSSVGRATHGCFIQDDVFCVLFIRQFFTEERTFFLCCYFISFLPSINSARKESTKVASASAVYHSRIRAMNILCQKPYYYHFDNRFKP